MEFMLTAEHGTARLLGNIGKAYGTFGHGFFWSESKSYLSLRPVNQAEERFNFFRRFVVISAASRRPSRGLLNSLLTYGRGEFGTSRILVITFAAMATGSRIRGHGCLPYEVSRQTVMFACFLVFS